MRRLLAPFRNTTGPARWLLVAGVLIVALFVVFALFSALFARLWFLQVGDAQSYAAQAARNRIRTIREPAIRGSIVDRDGQVLVQNTLVDTITIQRDITPEERAITVKNLAGVLAVSPDSIDAELDSPKYSVYEPVPIAPKATREQVTYILEHPELFDISRAIDGTLELRSFAFHEIEGKSHRRQRQEEVRKEDGGVDFQTSNRLQGDFRCEVRRATDFEQRIL